MGNQNTEEDNRQIETEERVEDKNGVRVDPAKVEAAFRAGRIPSRVKRIFCGGDFSTIRKVRPCSYCGRPHGHNNACCSSDCFKAFKASGYKPLPADQHLDWNSMQRFFCKNCGANYAAPATEDGDDSKMHCPSCHSPREDGGVELVYRLTNDEIKDLLGKQKQTEGVQNVGICDDSEASAD